MKAKLYKVHRILSLILFIPIVLWSLSGILHPIMANWFRIIPAQKSGIIQSHSYDSTRISIDEICIDNNLKQIQNIGLISLENEEVYQIKHQYSLDYFDTHTGKKIENGDKTYASELARHYTGDNESEIVHIEKVTSFSGQYKTINRLLPVYRVVFDRTDGLEAYVHTESGGLGTLNNTYRKAYLWCFSMFHNWDFLGTNQTLKSSLILFFSILVFFNGLLGLFIYWKNRKAYKRQKRDNEKLKPRKRHRSFSLFTSLFLLAFSFSGGYHTVMKFNTTSLNDLAPDFSFTTNDLDFSVDELIDKCGPLSHLSMAQIDHHSYIRVKDTSAQSPFYYFDYKQNNWLENGDELFSIDRALSLSSMNKEDVKSTEYITHYTRRYGFINKRLPVYAIHLDTPDEQTYYIETSTGIPGAIHTNDKKLESFSFLFLHKYHFLNFMGKGWRDLISAIAALTLVVISITGLLIWLKTRRKKSL